MPRVMGSRVGLFCHRMGNLLFGFFTRTVRAVLFIVVIILLTVLAPPA
jgi:hypothetical protein